MGPAAAARAAGGVEGAETSCPWDSSSVFHADGCGTKEGVTHGRELGRRRKLVTLPGRATPMVIGWVSRAEGLSDRMLSVLFKLF